MEKGQKKRRQAKNRIELAGEKIGRLNVIEGIHKPGIERLFYRCICECGKEIISGAQALRRGNTRSCGCLRDQKIKELNFQHGMSHTPMHNRWWSMIQRCTDKNCKAYPAYGGRGITVCERWMDFNNFLEDVGFPPSENMSLDRIDNNGNYDPGNVKWSTKSEQANNRRSNRMITCDGKTKTVAEWSRISGIPVSAIFDRISRGWEPARAVTQPSGAKHRRKIF